MRSSPCIFSIAKRIVKICIFRAATRRAKSRHDDYWRGKEWTTYNIVISHHRRLPRSHEERTVGNICFSLSLHGRDDHYRCIMDRRNRRYLNCNAPAPCNPFSFALASRKKQECRKRRKTSERCEKRGEKSARVVERRTYT